MKSDSSHRVFFQIFFTLCLLFSLTNTLFAQESLTRMGLFVGANEGGKGRTPLRYAASDALAFASVLQELGAMTAKDTEMLYNPDPSTILEQLKTFKSRIQNQRKDSGRVEFIFYYSGHSDETSLLLGSQKLPYSQLRTALKELDSDVQVAVLDSCYSGAITRLKGGVRGAPFLIDESNILKGHAYLTSSSENEASQESDRIGGSFFTYYLISGLRGAADSTGDGRVTLNEVYHHAFNETLARTESTQAGPQHPSYEIQLTGTGDLILTDLGGQSARMLLGKELEGRTFIRTSKGRLVAELQKRQGDIVQLALKPGEYQISIQGDEQFLSGRQTLTAGESRTVSLRALSPVSREANTTRGPSETDEPLFNTSSQTNTTVLTIQIPNLPEIPFLPFFNPEDPAEEQLPAQMSSQGLNIGLLPGLELHPEANKSVDFSFHALIGQAAETRSLQASGLLNFAGRVQGFQFAGIGNSNSGSSDSIQGAGVFNFGLGHAKGIQAAGVFNLMFREYSGIQAAGVFNKVDGTMEGIQAAGVFNKVNGAMEGIQAAGIFNQTGNFKGLQVAPVNIADDVDGFQIGVVNISKKLTGFSLALITLSDSSYYRYRFLLDTNEMWWHSILWGQNQFFTTVSIGSQGSTFWAFKPERASLTMGYTWGDFIYLSVAGGVTTGYPTMPEALWSLWSPTLDISTGINFGILGLFVGGRLEYHHQDWFSVPVPSVQISWHGGIKLGN